LVAKSPLQYWQVKRSRRNTLNRVKAGRRAAGTYSFRAMTLGSRISKDGLWIIRSYSEMTLTRSRNTALTASCQDQIDNGKYDRGRKSALSTSAWQDSRPGVTARPAAAESGTTRKIDPIDHAVHCGKLFRKHNMSVRRSSTCLENIT
jgi:hypothetical protein